MKQLVCAQCGKEFESDNWRRKSCSPECARLTKRAKNRKSQNKQREAMTGRVVVPRVFKTTVQVETIKRAYFAILRFKP